MLFSLVLITQLVLTDQEVRTDRQICGLNCLKVISSSLGDKISEPRFEEILPKSNAPYSMADLSDAAVSLGYTALAMHSDNIDNQVGKNISILHIRGRKESEKPDHFVVLFGQKEGRYLIEDFPGDPFFVTKQQLMSVWEGDYLEIGKSDYRSAIKRTSTIITIIIAMISIAFLLMRAYLLRIKGQKK
jgi:ABC-type bacteriocin/lantibiotic exporter with double-glycine peptidase domain